MITKSSAAIGLAASLLLAAASQGALAQATGQSTEPPTTFDRIEKTLSEATTKALDYISGFIPYSMPEVQENGDIVIRRDKPKAGVAAENPSATPAPQTPGSGTGTNGDVKI